jgi:hypothetical protein
MSNFLERLLFYFVPRSGSEVFVAPWVSAAAIGGIMKENKFWNKEKQRWLERERKMSDIAKMKQNPLFLVPPALAKQASEMLERQAYEVFSHNFTDWKGVYGHTEIPGGKGNDPLRDAIDRAVEELS